MTMIPATKLLVFVLLASSIMVEGTVTVAVNTALRSNVHYAA